MKRTKLVQLSLVAISTMLVTTLAITNAFAGLPNCSNCITAGDIATGAVRAAELNNDLDDSITQNDIAAGGVGAAEISGSAVRASEIAAGAVGSSEIASSAVGSSEIASSAVGASEIASGAVGLSELAAAAETSAVSGFHDAGVLIGVGDDDLFSLDIPAGTWLILATTTMEANTSGNHSIDCVLSADTDSDNHRADLDGALYDKEGIALMVIHTFAAPGSAVLTCDGADNSDEVEDTTITAIKLEGGATSGALDLI